MNLKKAGFILFLAGLTLGLATVAPTFAGFLRAFQGVAAEQGQPQPEHVADVVADSVRWTALLGGGSVLLLLLGAGLLVAGMLRSGPRDEELPTAAARRR